VNHHEVAVTGLGVMAPHGDEPGALFEALLQGRSAIQPVFPELPKPAAAATVAFDETRWFTKLQLAGVDRVSQLAVAAADLACAMPNLSIADADPERVGVYAGCGMGGAAALEAAYRGNGRVSPLTIPAFMPNAPAAHVAMRQGVLGPVLTYSVACASSSVAIAEAAKAIQRGEVDIAIAGGSEALIVPGVVLAWQAMQTLATFQPGEAAGAVRPFASDRSGFALGEGAAFLVLESAERARRAARAATPRWPAGASPATPPTSPSPMPPARRARCARRCGRPACSRATWATATRTARPRASATWSSATRWPRCGATTRRPARELHQGAARPHARRGRRHRGAHHGARAAAAAAAAQCELRRDRSGLRA
jgi:3-oxoacyl-[acyl-carrier-protein] synthase II